MIQALTNVFSVLAVLLLIITCERLQRLTVAIYLFMRRGHWVLSSEITTMCGASSLGAARKLVHQGLVETVRRECSDAEKAASRGGRPEFLYRWKDQP